MIIINSINKSKYCLFISEHSTPEFEEFLKLLGRKVRLRNYSGYIGGLDYRNDSTGLETYVTEFRGTNIVFLVSTLLPYEPNKVEQLARKRHIGNSSVTFIFVEEGAKPFQPDTIISGFQKVLIIVKYIRLSHNENNSCKFAYRVAVCRAKEVPPFGPVISSDYLFEHHTSFANLLLIKAINAAYAVLKYSKFREIMQRSRRDYLHQFCTEHTISTENENTKHGKMHIYRRHSQDKLKQLKNSIKFLGNTTPSLDREITPTKFQLDKIISFNQITGILQINNSSNHNNNNNLSNPKSYDDLYQIHQRIKRNHSCVLKSNQNYVDHLDKNRENIHLSSTFHNLLDFGQSIYVGLKKWQKVDGWHSVMELLPNSLLNNNNNVDVDEHSLDNFIYLPITHNHYFETQIGINRNWLLIFAPYTISSHLANRILLAIPLVSIFAYLFEHNKKVLRIYFDCGQYVQIQDIYNSCDLNGQNILEQLINFISYCIYPKVLQKCSQIMMKIKNTPNNFTNDDDNDKLFINDTSDVNSNYYYDKPQNSIQTTNHFNTIKQSTNNNNKCWSISEMGLSLSCLSPIDNYNILNSSLHTSSSSSITTIVPSLSSYSHSPFSLNPFPYILNFQKKSSDFYLFKQKNQIILQIGSYHLPELIRTLQSRKSLWCLQKLNLFAPFFNFYFPLIYDLQFSTHLLSLINKLKFSTTFKMILCDLPEIEILNRARIRYHRQQYVKHYVNNNNNDNIRKELLPIGLPHIIHVSNVYSNQNIQTIKNLQVSSDVRTTDRSKYYSLDVPKIFPADLYKNSLHHQNDNSSTTKNDDETSIDFTSNVVPTMDLIETANYVQSRRRTRKPEIVYASTVDQSLNKELHFTNRQKISISTGNNEAHQGRNEIHNRSGSCPIHITNKSPEKSNLSASLSTMNPDSNKTNDISTDNSPSLSIGIKPNIPVPVKWRRAITEKGNLSHNTDAKIVTIRRRIDTTEINTWNTKAHENTTLNKLEQIRSNNLTVNNTMKLTNTSTDYIPPMKSKSRLAITKETFRQPQNTMKFSNAAMNQYNTETKQHSGNHQMTDSTGLSENELRDRLRKISEELHM
ncbi:Signal-induced proliferation-associated 1-like protein 2 [Schistosoma japonicum]|nr:Signal-induced proliferation-associated 1-like protein 2 [Schistosoma japonicum]